MNTASLDKWAPVAWAVEEPLEQLPVPVHVFFGEATDVLKFTRVYWHGSRGGKGLASAVSENGRLRASVSQDILELIDAYQTVETQHRLIVAIPGTLVADHANTMVGKIRDTVGWYFTDASNDMGQARLDKLDRLHAEAYSHDALAAALFDYAGLAEMYADQIQGVLGFDASDIQEARDLARELRARSGAKEFPNTNEDPRRLQELRMRIATLIYERMQMVRAAARVVFKDEPRIVKLVTSKYQRVKQAEYRRRAEEEANASADAPSAAETPAPPTKVADDKGGETEAA